MTGRTVHVSVEGLRRAAGVVRRMTGLRVEIAHPPAAPPTPRCGKHAGNVHLLGEALRPVLPPGRAVVDGAGVELPEEAGGGYVVPDLVVCPAGFLREEAFLSPQDVELVVEVVPPWASPRRLTEAIGRYAAAGVRALLVVDPRAGQGCWSLQTEPVAGHYWAVRRGTDEAVPLPEPFRPRELTVPMARLPRYARR